MDELTWQWQQAIDYDDYHDDRFGVKHEETTNAQSEILRLCGGVFIFRG